MRNFFYGIVILVVGFVSFGASFSDAASALPEDWLKEAYRESHTRVSEPYSSDIEAADLFQQSLAYNVGGPNAGLGGNDNVVVRFSRFLMRMTIVIAVTMLIITGIKVAWAFGDSAKLNAALKDAGIVLLGVFIALASVAIIYLVSSLMRGNLDYALFNEVGP